MIINKSKQFKKRIVKSVVFLRFTYKIVTLWNPLEMYMISNY